MKILVFAGSNSNKSINKQLLKFACSLIKTNNTIELIDINDYEMYTFSVDKLDVNGIPDKAKVFAQKIDNADAIITSLAEHNGTYTAAFKNLYDWTSAISKRTMWNDTPIFIMATSPGPRGGINVLEAAKVRFPWDGGKILNTFSLPNFDDNFSEKDGITNKDLKKELNDKLKAHFS